MTLREEWLMHYANELDTRDEHICSKRFLGICRDIVHKIQADPNFQPPTYQSVMAGAPWGP
jgi:hypothetical protein